MDFCSSSVMQLPLVTIYYRYRNWEKAYKKKLMQAEKVEVMPEESESPKLPPDFEDQTPPAPKPDLSQTVKRKVAIKNKKTLKRQKK